MFINQYGGGACSLCGSAGTNKTTCPLNPNAANKVATKHPLAKVPSPAAVPVLPVATALPLTSSSALTLPLPSASALTLPLPLTSGRPRPPSLIKGAVKLKAPAKKTVTAPVTVKRTVRAKAIIAKIFNRFYPIWATYHRDRGQDYKGLFIGTKTSAEARGFVDFIYDTCKDDPETIRFWVGATQKDILDELYDNQGAYFRNFSLKLN
jgi:hypothetical protein